MTGSRILVGSLATGVPPTDATVVFDLGADHPTHPGLLQIDITAVDGVVASARVRAGLMHRGAEKLFEVREYRQLLMLADRHDWQAPFAGELAAALAVEQMLGLEAPARAVWLRTLLAEHTRILSHLGLLGWPVRTDAELSGRIRAAREEIREHTRALTGNRIHPMVNRLGGVAADPSPVWLDSERGLVGRLSRLADEIAARSLPGATAGPVTAELVDSYGLSGPLARAAGVALDLRTERPYLAYADLPPLPQTTAGAGDAAARFAQLTAEVRHSADLVAECCVRLPEGPVQVRLPKIVKVPEGETYLAVEAPLGRAGFHLVSRGDKTPWRMKLRSPSFHHVAALEAILPGCPVESLEAVLASIGWVIGDVDK